MKKSVGPDQGWSWVVAGACFFSSLILAGIFRTSGVLFVAFIDSFGVSREEASWPMVLCISVLNLTGPFSGILGQIFGARPIIIIGALIATIGISACFLAVSLDAITILFGVVFGIGWGFMNTLMPGVLNSYFLNLRATANGIANSGSCFGSIILPAVFEYFIYAFGLSGCFLLTGGIVLHLTISGILMRPPAWLTAKEADDSVKYHSFQTGKNRCSPHKVEDNIRLLLPKTPHQDIKESEHEDKSSLLVPQMQKLDDASDTSESQKFNNSKAESVPEISFDNININMDIPEEECSQSLKTLSLLKKNIPLELPCCNTSDEKSLWNIIRSFAIVLTCPMFYVTAITNVSFYFLYHMYVVIIVDFAMDRNVPKANAKDLLFAFSIADLFGRLCLGWITDRKFISRSKFVMICMGMIGVVFFLFPFSTGYWLLITSSCCYGLLLGCTMVIFPILLVDFLGIELHAVSYGLMCFMNGFASFGRPFLIGYFRDKIGSYSNMFYVLGGISLAASVLWLLESLFIKKKKSDQHV